MRQVPPCKCIEERTVALFSIRIVAKRPDKWLQELPPHLLLSWVLSSDWESFPRYQEKTLNLRNREIWEEGKDLPQSPNPKAALAAGPRSGSPRTLLGQNVGSADFPRLTKHY